MKIFLTEFKVGSKIYEGPYLYAESFEEADIEATLYGVVIVGEAKIVQNSDEEEWNRVLH